MKIASIWKSEEESRAKVEFFSEKKLAYFCLKAMEALEYLHTRNMYFGDMKPENLLVFRDYKVKLGDFGVSLKLPDTCTDKTELYMRGGTKEYCIPKLYKIMENADPMTKKDLWMNDNHSTWKTF